jgi:hypothetical protein
LSYKDLGKNSTKAQNLTKYDRQNEVIWANLSQKSRFRPRITGNYDETRAKTTQKPKI